MSEKKKKKLTNKKNLLATFYKKKIKTPAVNFATGKRGHWGGGVKRKKYKRDSQNKPS